MGYTTAIEVGRLYGPIKAIADSLTAGQQDLFIRLPGLRGYWPMSAVDNVGAARDHSGNGMKLNPTGTPVYGFDGDAYVESGSGTNYLTTPAPLPQVTGLEGWIETSTRGMTLGGWFNVRAVPSSSSGYVSLWGTAPQRSYSILWNTAGFTTFFASGDGTALVQVNQVLPSILTWVYIVARFTPGAEIALFVNRSKVTNTTSIPASLFPSSFQFEVGRYDNNNARILRCRHRDVFLCATSLDDDVIARIFSMSGPAV